jgi:hypothetical protein
MADVAASPHLRVVANDNVQDMFKIETAPDRHMMGNGTLLCMPIKVNPL